MEFQGLKFITLFKVVGKLIPTRHIWDEYQNDIHRDGFRITYII